MTCRDVRELIVETLSGTTPPDRRRMVEAHLASCAACRAEAASVEQTMGSLRRVPERRVHGEYWDGFMVHLEARLAAERRRPWHRVRRWFRHPLHAWTTAGAAAALIVALGAALVVPGRPPAGVDQVPDAATVRVLELVSPQVVEGIPAMDASLAAWKAGLGAGEVSYELTGGR
jgi:anti-sigma factor RsiW